MPTTEIIAHRGASHDAPENTLTSVNLGWEQNADAVEIDVFLSLDGHIVALHDPHTGRTAGVQRPVKEQTLQELRLLDAGSWKAERFAGEKIPTLDEIVATVPEAKRLVIEIKCGVEVVPTLASCLQSSGKLMSQFVLLTSSFEVLQVAKAAIPTLATLWLQEKIVYERAGVPVPSLETIIERANNAGLEGLSFDRQWPVNATLIRQIKAAGLEFHVWTVDDPTLAQRLIDDGADGITTNRPLWLRQQVSL